MKQTWRWFGPLDDVSVDDMLQSGVEGVVTALHDIKPGEVWTRAAIHKRIDQIATRSDGTTSGLSWDVVESLPVSEQIKTQTGCWQTHLKNYIRSLENLAAEGVRVVCYNFMPVLDWTRTDTAWQLPHGGSCMRFDLTDFALFDIHVLERQGALEEYEAHVIREAQKRFHASTDEQLHKLSQNITKGLPGAVSSLTREQIASLLGTYTNTNEESLREHLKVFLEAVIPAAEELSMRLCCHPDDPPWPILGLPRIVSTEDDLAWLLAACDSPANGLTFCSGSLGARPDNSLAAMIRRFGSRIHFLHLRNVRRESDQVPLSFFEDSHLSGSTDMIELLRAILEEERQRRADGRVDHQIPMRPDHGQDILTDLARNTQPGYPLCGRMRGLAELRGAILALST